MSVIDQRNDQGRTTIPGARIRTRMGLFRLPRRLLRRGRWGVVVALVLYGAYAWRGRGEGPVPHGAPAFPAEPPAAREGPTSITVGRILVHMAADGPVSSAEVAILRLTIAEHTVEVQAAGQSREALVAWADQFTTRSGPSWRLVTVALDEEPADAPGVSARIRWRRPIANRPFGPAVAAGMSTQARVDEFLGGLDRVARWSVVTRLDVDSPSVTPGRAASDRLPEASVTAQLTWAQLLAMVADMEGWAEVSECDVVPEAEALGETLVVTARLVPRVGTPRSAAPSMLTVARGAPDADIARSDSIEPVSPFASAMWRTGDLGPGSPVTEEPRRPVQSRHPATAAERWLVHGIVQAADGWRAAIQCPDGATRVVRVGDRLDGEAEVMAISWDGVRVSAADPGSGRSQTGESGSTTSGDRRQPASGVRP